MNENPFESRKRSASLVLGSALVLFNLYGCFHDPQPGEPQWVTKNVGDAYWCATITTAVAEGNGGNYPEPISYDDQGTTVYPTYCACAPEFWINNAIHDHLGPQGSVITSADEQEVQAFRDQLFGGAVMACVNMYGDLYGEANPAPTGEDCDEQLAAGISPITLGVGTCPLEVPFEEAAESETGESDGETGLPMPEDHWSDYYSLTSSIQYNSSGTYEIDDIFFNDMLDHPEWLLGDSAYITLNGGEWTLFNVTSGSIAHALGLQSGDIPLYLNSYDISTPEGALTAFASLQSATSFILVVERRGSSTTLSYDVI